MITKNRVIGVLLAYAIWETIVEASHIRAANRNAKLLRQSEETCDYLVTMLDERGAQLTDFDKIALSEIQG